MSYVDNAVSSAKAELARANKKFPSAPASSPKPTAKATPTPPAQKSTGEEVAEGIRAVQENVNQYKASAPEMHHGGTVPKTGVYTLEKGEKVIPSDKVGRSSEYRKVYLNRKTKTVDAKPQTRQGGGNTPVKGESHDSGSKKVPYKQAQE